MNKNEKKVKLLTISIHAFQLPFEVKYSTRKVSRIPTLCQRSPLLPLCHRYI